MKAKYKDISTQIKYLYLKNQNKWKFIFVIMTIGEKIEAFIKSKGIKKSDLAKKLGRSPSALNGLLKQSNIGSKHLEEIAQALETPLYLLFMYIEEEEESTTNMLQESPADYGQNKDKIILAQRKEIERLNKLVEDLKKIIY